MNHMYKILDIIKIKLEVVQMSEQKENAECELETEELTEEGLNEQRKIRRIS